MLYPIYQVLKQHLNDPSADGLEGIDLPNEWFNMQYDGTMIHDEGFFIEFPNELNFESVSTQMRRAPLRIRLHHYTKIVTTHDGIPDSAVLDHEVIGHKAKKLLDGFTPLDENGNKLCERLQFAVWRHWHRWKGRMVTYVEFESKKVL